MTLVVPFGPGSGTDLVARHLAAPLGERLGQTMWCQNSGGAGGLIGVSRVAKAAPDGYELVMGAVDTFAQSPSLRKQPPYDPISDFVPAGLAVMQPLILIARKDLPVSNMREFADYVKSQRVEDAVRLGRRRHREPPGLLSAHPGDGRQRHAHLLPRLGRGDDGHAGRTSRLLLHPGDLGLPSSRLER